MNEVTATEVPGHLKPGVTKQRRVVSAANRIWSARIQGYRIICSARHLDPLMHAQIANSVEGKAAWRASEQGFVDQWGTWMDRTEAFTVASAAGQILYTKNLPTTWLDSSHLY